MADADEVTMAPWVCPSGSLASPGHDVELRPGTRSWTHTGLGVLTLAPGVESAVSCSGQESVVVPLSGAVAVTATMPDGSTEHAALDGRPSVFAGPTDVCYVPAVEQLVLLSELGARVALCWAPVGKRSTPSAFRHVRREEVPVELRGAGRASREVRNFATPAVLDADSLIACEVVTPAGNWSSYPPHKHDEERPGVESELEEIYYFELQTERSAMSGPQGPPWPCGDVAAGRSGSPGGELSREARGEACGGVAYQRVYGTEDRPIDVLAEIRTGDVVLVPHGWHGPSMAPPGYDLYYLNVMAGPGPERAWLVCDDPAHGWVRDTWVDQEVDPRLPTGKDSAASGTSAARGAELPDASGGDQR